MYAVVGCGDCSALWIVEGRPETSECPQCGTRRGYEKRRKFVETDDEDHAREVRASMLANRSGEGEAFADLDSFSEMEARIDDAGPSDEEYLDGSGIDPEEVAAAGERAERRTGDSQSRKATVREAVSELDEPTAEEVVAYARERGIAEERAREILDKLVRAGEVSENRGTYRAL